MSVLFKAGNGITITESDSLYWRHERISVSEISLNKSILSFFDGMMASQPGDVLMKDRDGNLRWGKPFDNDEELRREYPALEQAWDILMEAVENYYFVRKLVKDPTDK